MKVAAEAAVEAGERTAVHPARRSPSQVDEAGGLPWDILQGRRASVFPGATVGGTVGG